MSSIPRTYYKYKKQYKKFKEQTLPEVSKKAETIEKIAKWVPGKVGETVYKGAKWVKQAADEHKVAPGTIKIPDKYK